MITDPYLLHEFTFLRAFRHGLNVSIELSEGVLREITRTVGCYWARLWLAYRKPSNTLQFIVRLPKNHINHWDQNSKLSESYLIIILWYAFVRFWFLIGTENYERINEWNVQCLNRKGIIIKRWFRFVFSYLKEYWRINESTNNYTVTTSLQWKLVIKSIDKRDIWYNTVILLAPAH